MWTLAALVPGDGFAGWVESVGQRGEDTVGALRVMGAEEHAECISEVLRLFPDAGAADADARLAVVAEWSSAGPEARQLRALDERFLTLVNRDGLVENYVAPYIRGHPDEIPMDVEDL